MTVNSNNGHPLYYIEITFSASNVPETMAINENEGRLEKYRGTTEERYIWNLYKPGNESEANKRHTIRFKSRSNIKITKIIIRSEGIGAPTYVDP